MCGILYPLEYSEGECDIIDNRSQGRGNGIIASTVATREPIREPIIMPVSRNYEFTAKIKISIPDTPEGMMFLRTLLAGVGKDTAVATFPIGIDTYPMNSDEFNFDGDLNVISPISITKV